MTSALNPQHNPSTDSPPKHGDAHVERQDVGITADKTYAAIDLGSNSFHMAVASTTSSHLQMIDKLREPVRLGAGLDKKNNITAKTMKQALECLSMFSQRLKDVPTDQIRAVGTNTLRRACNAEEFNLAAVDTLGVPIEIISGREEARLIFTGVSYGLRDDKKRLVIDIGGGSTEFIAGSGTTANIMESINMGCVSTHTRWFDDQLVSGKKLGKKFEKSIAKSRQEARAIIPAYLKHGWDVCIGSSGTIKATEKILQAFNPDENGISRERLDELIEKIIKKGPEVLDDISTISDDRREVILGGLSVLKAAFESLDIKHMQVSHSALREGVIIDLAGDSLNDHVRRNAVADMQQRFRVDIEQATRVYNTAEQLFSFASDPWNLDATRDLRTLRSACHLHEVGLSIAHVQYHKHGAYLLRNADMMGFSRNDQRFLAALVRNHRRKIDTSVTQSMRKSEKSRYYKLLFLLRLASLFHRTRHADDGLQFTVDYSDSTVNLSIQKQWLEDRPLTRADIEDEIETLNSAGFYLNLNPET